MPEPTRASLEQRLVADEARLARDEARLEAEESGVRESQIVAWLATGLAVAAVVAVVALVLAIVALQEDVGSIRHAVPANSVTTAALRDGSVTAGKLAPGIVDHSPI